MGECVSVIIPIYNVCEFLEACVDSVISQTYSSLDIILVDDGSTDGSEHLCELYKNKDTRIRVIHKENGGLSSARNVGIQNALGNYLAFVDSDDYIEKNMIETLMMDIQKHNAQIACCNFKSCNQNGEMIDQNQVNIKGVELYDSKVAISKLLYENYFKCFAWNKIYLKSLFDNIRYPDGKLYEDITTTYQLMKKAARISFNEKCLYNYRVRQNSITHKKFDNRSYDLVWAVDYLWSKENDSEVRCGCVLYLLYFIDDMIRYNYWDDDIYKKFKNYYKLIKTKVRKNKDLKIRRKIQMALCYHNKKLYKIVYLYLIKSHK